MEICQVVKIMLHKINNRATKSKIVMKNIKSIRIFLFDIHYILLFTQVFEASSTFQNNF